MKTKLTKRSRSLWLWLPLLLVAASLNGCLDSQRDTLVGPSAGGAAGGAPAFQPPSIDEIAGVVSMSDAQKQQLTVALDQLSRDMASRPQHQNTAAPAEGEGRRAHAQGPSVGLEDREAPFLTFVEAGAQILDANQFASMAKFLAARRESAQKSRHGAHGFHGGPGGPGGPGGGGFILGRILREDADQLALTQEQKDKLQALVAPTKAGFEALRTAREKGTSDDQLRAQGKALREKVEADVAAILNAAQNAKRQQLIAEHRAKFADEQLAQLGAHTQRHVDFLTKALVLTPPQTVQVRTILAGTEASRRAALEAVKSGQAHPEDILAKGGPVEALEGAADAVRAVLTPEQTVRYDAIRLLVPGHRPS